MGYGSLMNLYADPNDYGYAGNWYADVYGDYGSLMNLKKKGFNPFSKKNMNMYKKNLRKAGNTKKSWKSWCRRFYCSRCSSNCLINIPKGVLPSNLMDWENFED